MVMRSGRDRQGKEGAETDGGEEGRRQTGERSGGDRRENEGAETYGNDKWQRQTVKMRGGDRRREGLCGAVKEGWEEGRRKTGGKRGRRIRKRGGVETDKKEGHRQT
jgi:hypothetical protein